jgi:hypothetical protein
VALGYYTLAFRVAILPFLTVTYVLAGVSFPYYARAASDLERVRDAFRTTLRLGMAATVRHGTPRRRRGPAGLLVRPARRRHCPGGP